MTVQELIKKLLEFDPELEVMYEDYENGESEISEVKIDEHRDWSRSDSLSVRRIKQYVSLS